MGRSGDPRAVVDSRARVIGVNGLRVVDASALPFLPPGHPSAVICESNVTESVLGVFKDNLRSWCSKVCQG